MYILYTSARIDCYNIRGGMIWVGRESGRKWFYKNEKKKSQIIYDGRHVAGARCYVYAFNRRRIYLCNRYVPI